MASMVIWKRDTITVEWNKEGPYSVTVHDPLSHAEYVTTHRNERAAIAAARRKHKQLRNYLFDYYIKTKESDE